jgi:hypothetical protein
MAILYRSEGIELRDDSGVMEPVFLPRSSTAAEVDAAVIAYGFPPGEDWLAFKALAMENPQLTALMQEVSAGRPQLLGWLTEALARAEAGSLNDFKEAWSLVVGSSLVSDVLLESFAETAFACGLPATFCSILRQR